MRLIFDISDRLFSWFLLGAGVFTIWVASLLIREQNMTAPDDEVGEQWRTIMEAFRSRFR